MTAERSSHGARTLPAVYYHAPEIYDLERVRIFERRWLCVGLAAAIPEPGAFFVVELEGESIVVVRGSDERIRAFYNVCRHRGTRLCAERSGHFRRHVVCPYHAWAYDLEGALASAPNMQGVPGFDPREFPLAPVAVHVWEGLVFVHLAPATPAFEDALAPLVGKFDRWRLADLVPVHRTAYEVAANWKLLIQNYSECYHCPTLHPALNRLTPYKGSSNDLDEGPVLGGPMRLSDEASSMTVDGRACAAPFDCLTGAERRLVYYYVVFPSLFLSLMPDYAMIHRLERRGPGVTTIVCEWLFHPDAVARQDFDPSGAVEFWDRTNRQDWEICERSQQGIGSRAYVPGPYADLESLLAALDREYLGALGRSTDGG